MKQETRDKPKAWKRCVWCLQDCENEVINKAYIEEQKPMDTSLSKEYNATFSQKGGNSYNTS